MSTEHKDDDPGNKVLSEPLSNPDEANDEEFADNDANRTANGTLLPEDGRDGSTGGAEVR